MRTETIVTNLTCNQNCTYCTARRPTEDPAFVQPAAVRARIDAALEAGATELVLTGGEPTLRKDLEQLVAFATRPGVRVVLETNATLLDLGRAQALRDAGLTTARVNLTAWGEPLDVLTQDPGGFQATLLGLQALAAVRQAVELNVAVVRSTVQGLAQLPDHMAAVPGLRAVLAEILVRVPIESPDPAELLPLEHAARAVVALERAARRHGLPVRLAGEGTLPPCVFEAQGRPAWLFSLARGRTQRQGFTRVPSCDGCLAADACPGLPERARVPAVLYPVTDPRQRRRLAGQGSLQAQADREFPSPNRTDRAGVVVDETVVRVNFQCNQACTFCFVSTHLPAPDQERVRAAIIEAGQRGAKITLSGGEPTLNPRLVQYVALAKAHGRLGVQLQTNAIRLQDPVLMAQLVEAGLDEAFVSLHGTTAEVSDAVTQAPGTFEQTLLGLDQLHRSPVRLHINFVVCQANLHQLVSIVQWVGRRWPGAFLNVSFVAASTDLVPRDQAMLVRYTDALPQLVAAMEEADRLGVPLLGMETMCGVPLCLTPGDAGRWLDLPELDVDGGGEFIRAQACDACALRTRCYGIRRGYAEVYGDAELRTVSI